MKIQNDKWVSIHYTLKDDAGKEIDSSVGNEPLGFVFGRGYLISGLEKQLEGKEPGEKFQAVVQPEEGYGKYDERLVMKVGRDQFETDLPIEIGMKFQVMTPAGVSIVTVTKVEADEITIDGNHELADKVLHFDVEVVEVRDATDEELNPPSCGGGCGSCSGDCSDGSCGGCGGCH